MFKLIRIFGFLLIACYFQAVFAQSVDPTKPLGAVAVVAAGGGSAGSYAITLSSILIASDRKLAIINGQTLHEHESLKNLGITVIKIEKDAVTLKQGERVWRLPLNTIAIRK